MCSSQKDLLQPDSNAYYSLIRDFLEPFKHYIMKGKWDQHMNTHRNASDGMSSAKI